MNALNSASLINLLGFTAGVALYGLLLAMVVRHRRTKDKISFDLLLSATAVLGLLWNVGELSVFIWKDFGTAQDSPFILAISYSALGFLPSVVVHSAWKNSENENSNVRWLTFLAYGLSVFAGLLHFHSAIFSGVAPSGPALQILTVGSLVLLAGLLIFTFRQKIERKTIWIAALLIFAVSALHLNAHAEETSWLVELVAHQSSLPLALAILLQDYRFAFADLFLKRALSLLLLTLTAFGLYVFIAAPFLALHEAHDKNDVQATSILLTFWIVTALIYPALHRFAVLLVDKIILRRANYAKLHAETAQIIDRQNDTNAVLDEVCRKLSAALTAEKAVWDELFQSETNFPAVNFSSSEAEIFIPTAEAPFYRIRLGDFSGGRRLLSGEIEMLETLAFVAARRIDNLRVTNERHSQEVQAQEFSRLATEAELRALRAQINPHFLFNALTTIGYLIQTAPEKAFATLMKLTSLLRRVLKSSGEFSTLGEEIELIKFYLEIERARFEERLTVKFDIPKDLEKARVPSLILQPLVENAVKHGIEQAKDGGEVRISAKLESEKDSVFLKLSVFDTGGGKQIFARENGFGLNNIEQRLRSHYGKNAGLTIKSEAGRGTVAELKFQVSDANLNVGHC